MQWTRECEEEVSAPERAVLLLVVDCAETQTPVVVVQMQS